MIFVTASGQDGAGSPWGAGGEARPPPPQRMWPAAFLWGLAATQAGAGEGTVVWSALAAWRGRDDCLKALPLPHPAGQLHLPGESPRGTLLSGCASCSWRRRFDALFSHLPFSLLNVLTLCKVAVPSCDPARKSWGSPGWVTRTG